MRRTLSVTFLVLLVGGSVGRVAWGRSLRIVVDEKVWENIPVLRMCNPPHIESKAPIDSLVRSEEIRPAIDFAFLTSVAVVENYALVTDLGYNPHAAVVDLTTGDVVERFGRRDDRRHRLVDPRVVEFSRNDGTWSGWLWGMRENRLARFGEGEQGETEILASRQLVFPQQITRPARTRNGFVAGGYFDDTVVLFLSQKGEPTLRVSGAEPNLVPDSLGTLLTGMVNKSVAAVAPNGRVVVAFKWTDRILILGADGALLAVGDGPYGIVTNFLIEGGSPRFPPTQQIAYRDVATSENRIFVLFQGGETGQDVSSNSQVHVFDWEGHLHRVLQLDAPLTAISVWNGHLFGTEARSPSAIIRWETGDVGP